MSRNFLPIVYSCLVFAILSPFSAESALTVGFYSTTCPSAETTVRSAITTALNGANGPAASLIRLHFHDCFVRGCDASVLLNASPANPSPENNPVFNMRGLDLIDAAKTAVEAICPGVVSCADILAFAARDAFNLLVPGGSLYDVPAGRRDGNVSSFLEAVANLPAPTMNLTQLETTFAAKGFSLKELIALSGAHSIGQAHCSSFQSRLYPYDSTQIDPTFAQMLQGKCPQNATVNGVVTQDFVTPDSLDVQYYSNILNNKVLFFSDWALRTDPIALTTIVSYSTDNLLNILWRPDFIKAMQKLGQLDVLTGTQGQIRSTCGAVNP
ncbi:Peroxidase [Rhynchospora pubera]|uniref:Peroxidase n=1 Tax=Rhynchospora pubera TaxID=906938 RepID=A0AAV8D561_9POAL|nr:Peroxidase [Rhynchospora pubera]